MNDTVRFITQCRGTTAQPKTKGGPHRDSRLALDGGWL